MKYIITILFVFIISSSFSQKYKYHQWSSLMDSLGTQLFDTNGNYLVIPFAKFDSIMKKEISEWMIYNNATRGSRNGVCVSAKKWDAYRKYDSEIWIVIKRKKGKNY